MFSCRKQSHLVHFDMSDMIYCRSVNIREVLIFARIQESREKYYYTCNSATKEKTKFANSKLREKSQNQKFTKTSTRKLTYLQYGKPCQIASRPLLIL